MFLRSSFLLINLLCSGLVECSSSEAENKIHIHENISPDIRSTVFLVETKRLFVDTQYLGKDCLLGRNRCNNPLDIPSESRVPVSNPPPAAKNKHYQALAMRAESLVPQVWWRKGYRSDLLLLSHNDTDFPKKCMNTKSIRNKKLKNLHQCATRQTFIRKSFMFNDTLDANSMNEKCIPENSKTIEVFWNLWKTDKAKGGKYLKDGTWQPRKVDGEKIREAALNVLDDMLKDFGGIWTGCFKLIRAKTCRAVLAAASQILSLHNIADITGIERQKTRVSIESDIVVGYMLTSLGRTLMHGDKSTTGDRRVTDYGLKTIDFIALQGAYLQLYIESVGSVYTKQLDTYIPLSFPPSFQVFAKSEWKHLASRLEPVYSHLRNWMFSESSNLIDFGPYRPLVSFEEVRNIVRTQRKRRVLIDVGANGFFASPKYLLDSYSPYLPFTHMYMIEPEPHFSATVPEIYLQSYNITFLQIYAEVGTGSDTDVVKMLPTIVTKDDYVVLKFDVDPNKHAQGPTMEWGFLFSLMLDPLAASLVDELYIELHFQFPSLYWDHYHSNWEALDCIRYLRSKGLIVHSWP